MMMRFDNAEMLNLVIGRERAPSRKTPKHTFYKPYDELCEPSWFHLIFQPSFLFLPEYNPPTIFPNHLLSLSASVWWWWGRHSKTEPCLVIDALLFFLSTWTFDNSFKGYLAAALILDVYYYLRVSMGPGRWLETENVAQKNKKKG